MRYAVVGFLLLSALGCVAEPRNPSFPITRSEARDLMRAMAADPVVLPRPVVIVGGIFDPGLLAGITANHLRNALGQDDQVLVVAPGTQDTFEAARTHLIQAVQERWPSDDAHHTIEVDVVALSMGGLVARYAAIGRPLPGAGGDRALAPDDNAPHLPRQLRIARLFTLATPYRGAIASKLMWFDARAQAMRPGSRFLQALHAMAPGYEIVPYVRLNDLIVGAHMAAPPGEVPYWVPVLPLEEGHLGMWSDPRLLADIARRLRAEPPLTTGPPAPLPRQDKSGDD